MNELSVREREIQKRLAEFFALLFLLVYRVEEFKSFLRQQ
uniref:Uncharacterized protein n=1 Tax=Marseillevirus sp. TaxID=2809551 RepID=A0AA96EP47_9VIRU|nr:hypothetical protein MarDSR_085 [Marseillevirus sp.]